MSRTIGFTPAVFCSKYWHAPGRRSQLCSRHRRYRRGCGACLPYLAGACAALTAVKPHLLALFALWLVLDAFRSTFGRKVLLGGLLVALAAYIPPTVTNPNVWSQYIEATRGPSSADHHHVADWKPPVLGWWLRQAMPGQPFAVQCLPVGIAVVVFLMWCCEPRPDRIDAVLPWLVCFSLLAAPYGAWSFDLVLFLVPVIGVTVRMATHPAPAAIIVGTLWLASVNTVSLVMMMVRARSEWYVWVTPWVLLGVIVAKRLSEERASTVSCSVGARA